MYFFENLTTEHPTPTGRWEVKKCGDCKKMSRVSNHWMKMLGYCVSNTGKLKRHHRTNVQCLKHG